MNQFMKMIKCALLVYVIGAQGIHAMEQAESAPVSLPSPVSNICFPENFDRQLKRKITKHVKNYQLLFDPSGIKKMAKFQKELTLLINNKILFCGDNHQFKNDMRYLEMDYKHLSYISTPESSIYYVDELLTDIVDIYNLRELSLDFTKKSRYEKQFHGIDIIKYEASQHVATLTQTILEIETKSVSVIREILDVEFMLKNFLNKYRVFFTQIELERQDFCLILRNHCGETQRDLRFNAAIDTFPRFIKCLQKAEQKRTDSQDLAMEESISSADAEKGEEPKTTQKKSKKLFGFTKNS